MGAKRCRGKRVSEPGATTRRGVAVVMMMIVKVVMMTAKTMMMTTKIEDSDDQGR